MMVNYTPMLCLAAALLAGCAMPPEGTEPADLAAWDQAVASVGCSLETESDYLPVELQTGQTRALVQEIAAYKVASEEAVRLDSGGVRLITGACAPVPSSPAPAAG
jgi:hypothetical protein